MSSISSTSPIAQQAQRSGNTNDALRNVDLDQFLQLLITEMQNQDPLSPMENSEILQQISQIREISATDSLTDTLSAVLAGQNMATASSLIGQQVRALSDGAQNVEGRVERVSIEIDESRNNARQLRVHVGEHSIRLENIREIVQGVEE